jgi:nucleoside-diphosphate-sugar epimerase
MRIFLTGANGYLGRVLIEHLARLPEVEHITGIGLTRPSVPLPDRFNFIRLDIRSPELAAAMAGHEVVIHTACVVFWLSKMTAQERDDINLNGTRNVAAAARANKVGRFIHASSMAVYDPALARGQTDVAEAFPTGKGDSPFYYWNAKAEAERILASILDASTLLTCFRPIYIIGPRNPGVVDSYRKNAVRFPGQNPRRQFVHEDDVAAAFIQALFTPMPGAFNVVPDDFIRMNEVWKIIGVKFVPVIPRPMVRLITSIRWRYFDSLIHPSWVEDMLIDFTGSNARLKSTGWKPRYGSAEALRSAI